MSKKNINESKNVKKKSVSYFVIIIIALLVATAVQFLTVQVFSKAIIQRNFVVVDTSRIIEARRIYLLKHPDKLKDSKKVYEDFSNFIKTLKSVINSISATLKVVVLEKGAVVSDDVIDVTSLVLEKMKNAGYEIELEELDSIQKKLIDPKNEK
ncbi:hypothetical protein [Deferribacter abyssi]|uniref:hypothetical protein n=1 Tax=Deferribacter abyssi TaxID=213806 RepID=UPI003C26531F